MSGSTEAIAVFQTKVVRASLTRPANATAYTDGDVLAAADDSHLTFLEAVQPKKLSGSITTARVHSSANQGTKPELELWLFGSDIAEVGDNAPFAPSDAEALNLIGVIDFAESGWRIGLSGGGAAGNAVCQSDNIGLTFRAFTQNVYGVLVLRNAYTPVSGEVFTVDLVVTQD